MIKIQRASESSRVESFFFRFLSLFCAVTERGLAAIFLCSFFFLQPAIVFSSGSGSGSSSSGGGSSGSPAYNIRLDI
jgi:uncharacterized membrane protein YgcG